jgi:phage terminase large subunit
MLPNQFTLREYQSPVWKYFSTGGLRAVSVWHRRAGKDLTALHRTAVEAFKRVGTYWHMLPQMAQGRKVIWDGIVEDQHGKATKILEWAFPLELRKKTHVQEMKIELVNGSIWQLCGSDNYDSLIGSNPIGVIMSEYGVAKPSAWTYIRPILTENGGWAWFLYTPRGMNHGWDLYRMAQENPEWHCEILTVNDTNAIPERAIQLERNSGMSDDMIQQEFYCSFEAAIVGSYYAKLMIDLEKAGQVTSVPYDPSCPVHTSWDIGVDDCTAIWFWQCLPGGEIHAIDYLESSGEGVTYYLDEIRKRPYVYGTDYVPHDFEARSFAAGGKSAADTARQHGRRLSVIPAMSPLDRIEATRAILPRVWFDKAKTEEGRNALKSYRREWNEDRRTFMATPVHDWASHGSDAAGHFAVGYRPEPKIKIPGQARTHVRPGTESSGWMGR